MKRLGLLLMLAGVIGAIAALSMDTSVPSGLGGRINNIGLMKDQQNYLMVSSVMALVGIVMLVVAPTGSAVHEVNWRNSKVCPECAETIKLDAKMCRHCGNRDLAQAYQMVPPRKTLWDVLVWDRTNEPPG